MRRLIARPVQIAAAGLLLTVAGCAPVPTDVTYQPAAEAGDEVAREELLAALDKLTREPFSVEVEMLVNDDLIGMVETVDPTTGSRYRVMTFEGSVKIDDVEVLVIGTDVWMSLGDLHDVYDVETRWLYTDLSSLGGDG